jgi:hypothetical protein
MAELNKVIGKIWPSSRSAHLRQLGNRLSDLRVECASGGSLPAPRCCVSAMGNGRP